MVSVPSVELDRATRDVVVDDPTVSAPDAGAPRAPVWLPAAVVAVVVAGTVLRFWTRSDLWLDEALSVNIAKLPVSRIPGALRHDGAPPLYYLLLHGWIRLFGTGDEAVRSLGGVLSVVTFVPMWFAGRRVGGRAAAWAALLLLASSPFAVHYATEARMYSLVVLLAVLGFLALRRVLERPTVGRTATLAIVTVLLLLSHYWSIYLLVVVAAILVVRLRHVHDRNATLWALGGLAAGGVLFLPWAPTFLFQLRHTGTPWAEPAHFNAMVNAVSEFAGGSSSAGRALGLLFFALLGLGLFGRAVDERRVELDLRTRPRARVVAGAAVGTLAFAIALGLVARSAFEARYTSVVFPLFLLLAALGVTVFADAHVRTGVLVAAVVFGLSGCVHNVTTNRTEAGVVARTLRAEARPGDVVGYCPDQLGPAVSRLAGPGLVQLTFPRLRPPGRVDWVDYADHVRAGDPAAFARALVQRAGPDHVVWLVASADYHLLIRKCDEVNQQLQTLRPPGKIVVQNKSDTYFEHAALTRFTP